MSDILLTFDIYLELISYFSEDLRIRLFGSPKHQEKKKERPSLLLLDSLLKEVSERMGPQGASVHRILALK